MQDLKDLFHLRFIGYWLLLGLLWGMVRLPWRLRMMIGGWIGKLAFALAKHRQAVVHKNLSLVFPELSDKERAVLVRKFALSIGYGFIETGMAWFRSEKYLRSISRFEGDAAALSKVFDANQPVVLVGSHSTLMELGVRLLGLYVKSAGMFRPLKNRFFDRWIYYQRSRAATELVHFKDMRHVLKILKSGGNLWYALDQDMGRRVGVFASFFNIPASSVNVLPKLAERTGAAWIPVFIWREKKSYVVRILPEIQPNKGESDIQVMERVNRVYEQEIRRYPEQYFWVHRRFKTRPEANENWYPKR